MPKEGEELNREIHVDVAACKVFPHPLAEWEIEVILILKNDKLGIQPVAKVMEKDANNGNSSQGVTLVFAQ